MLNEKQLSEYFKIEHLPIKDGEFWDGKPFPYSNLNQWHLNFSQKFGNNPVFQVDTTINGKLYKKGTGFYSQFGMKGHNGIDIAFFKGTPIVAPCKLWITYLQDSDGYGKNVWAETESKQINGDWYKLEMCFGHNMEFKTKVYKWLNAGDLMSLGDSTGFSTGDHTHIGIRPYVKLKGEDWKQMFPNNGYLGWIEPEQFFPHIVWDLNELNNKDFMKDFKLKHDGKLIFNNDTGEVGWFYGDKLRTPKNADRGYKMLASYIIRKEGAHISDVDWDKLPKEDF